MTTECALSLDRQHWKGWPLRLLRWPVRVHRWFTRFCDDATGWYESVCSYQHTLAHFVACKKLVHHEVYLLEILVPHYFMIGWWMVLRKIIRPIMYSPFPIGSKVAHFGTIFGPMVCHIPGFGTFWLHKQADNSSACFAVQIKGVSIFSLQVFHGNVGVSDRDHRFSVEEHPSCFCLCCRGHYIFSVCQTVRIGPFSFGLGLSVGGGWLLR